jgi:Tfp pilus assembly protein PilE
MRARAMPVLAVVLPIPSVAVADTLTPWVSGTSPDLWLATLLLGVVEGAILSRLFGLKLARCAGFMIPANLVSSWVGLSLLRTLPGLELRDVTGPALILVLVSFVLTLLLEWPFVALCVRGSPGWLRRSVKGSLVVQSASYALLLVFAFVAARALPQPDAAQLSAMRSDLRNVVTAQESYFADHATYAGTLADLLDTTSSWGYRGPSAMVVIRITEASATGWSATSRYDMPADLQVNGLEGTTKTCGVFVGAATPPVEGQKEAEPLCR